MIIIHDIIMKTQHEHLKSEDLKAYSVFQLQAMLQGLCQIQ
jgi:hypothetical protein